MKLSIKTWVRQAVPLMTIALFIGILLESCGPKGNSSTSQYGAASNTEVSTMNDNSLNDENAKSEIIDEQMASRKKWQYQDYGSNGKLAMIYSQNSYKNNIGEIVYLGITLNKISDYTSVGGFNWMVSGGSNDGNQTVMTFSPTVNNVTISFDNSEKEVWYGVTDKEHSYTLFMITEIDDFIDRLKSSKNCTVDLDNEYGHFTYEFNVQNLKW